MTPIVIAIIYAMLPITYSCYLSSGKGEMSALIIYLPGCPVEGGSYYLGAGLAYPLYASTIPFKERAPSSMPDADKVVFILKKVYLDGSNYDELIRASHRKFALEHFGHTRFGYKTRFDENVKSEWAAWLKAGRPETPAAERRFAMSYWLYGDGEAPIYLNDEISAVLSKCAQTDWGEAAKDLRLSDFDSKHPSILLWRKWVASHGGMESVAKIADEKDAGGN